jgi:hypothetical protein
MEQVFFRNTRKRLKEAAYGGLLLFPKLLLKKIVSIYPAEISNG